MSAGRSTGHAGTLDPFATGLLIVLLGREATRCQSLFMALPKTYRVVARFGAVSTTGDPDGEITETGELPPGAARRCRPGEIRQRPPAYSAVKVGGVRAYQRARRGEVVEMPQREVTVHRFEQVVANARPSRARDRVLVGHLRAEPGRGARRRVLREPAQDRDRALRGRGGGDVPAAGGLRWTGCPSGAA